MRRSCTRISFLCAHEHTGHNAYTHAVNLARNSRIDVQMSAHLRSFYFSPNGTGYSYSQNLVMRRPFEAERRRESEVRATSMS